jgi:LysR family transcriptional regulator, regulator for bpeEF and oprC
MDRIDVMRLFIRVVDAGNFSKAARSTGISQPTVSKLIAGLETRLHVQFLRRTSRGLSVTDAGQEFYEAAVNVVANVDDVESRIGKGETSPAGLVRIALSPALGRMQIIPHLPAFYAHYPDIKLDFNISQRYVSLVEEGVDVAIRIGPLSDSSLLARRIGSMDYITAASPAYLERAGTPQSPDQLDKHSCIAFMSHDALRPWSFLGPDGPFDYVPNGVLRSNDAEYVRAAVLAGLGVGHNAGWLYAKEIEDGRLTLLMQSYAPALFPIHAVWPGSRRLPGKTRAFIDFLADLFDANPLLRVR